MAGDAICKRRFILLSVAVHTPTHRHLFILFDHIHLTDGAMALLALSARLYMRSVIEPNVVRQKMNLLPLNRVPTLESFHKFCEVGTVLAPNLTDLNVTVHAHIKRRNGRMSRNLNRVVTVLAINPELTRVQLVRVRDGLIRLVVIVVTKGDLVGTDCVDGPAATQHNSKAYSGTHDVFSHMIVPVFFYPLTMLNLFSKLLFSLVPPLLGPRKLDVYF